MREEYDFSNGVKRRDIARKLGAKKAVTIRLDEGIVDYFRDLSNEVGIPYQSLMNQFLRHCVVTEMRPTGQWMEARSGFVDWLFEQVNRADEVGELARNARTAERFPRDIHKHETLLEHLQEVGGLELHAKGANRAWQEWEAFSVS